MAWTISHGKPETIVTVRTVKTVTPLTYHSDLGAIEKNTVSGWNGIETFYRGYRPNGSGCCGLGWHDYLVDAKACLGRPKGDK